MPRCPGASLCSTAPPSGSARWSTAGRRAGREVSLLAVDEARCIVEWGSEFGRVRQLNRYRYLLGDSHHHRAHRKRHAGDPRRDPARAADPAGRDGRHVVRSAESGVLRGAGAGRPRAVHAHAGPDPRRRDGPVIVYTRRAASPTLVTRAAAAHGCTSAPYQARASPRAPRQVLRAFLADRAPVVVATSGLRHGDRQTETWPRCCTGGRRARRKPITKRRCAGRMAVAPMRDGVASLRLPVGDAATGMRRYVEAPEACRVVHCSHTSETGATCPGATCAG